MPKENRQPISLRRGWEAAAPSCREVLALHLKEVAHPLADLFPSPLPSPVLDLASRSGDGHGGLRLLPGSRDRTGGDRQPHPSLPPFEKERVILILLVLPPCSGSPPGLR